MMPEPELIIDIEKTRRKEDSKRALVEFTNIYMKRIAENNRRKEMENLNLVKDFVQL
ncbi:MAG: hypothetical protein QG670_663 [Thermoproteota archaeon]|nr:hypothetical protein [Thermoproteota archaeon]